MQCLGRRVRDKKKDEGTGVFWFVRPRHRFFVPFRCGKEAKGTLCTDCIERQKKTDPYVAKMSAKGTHIPNQGTLFHGLLTEVPPTWSHCYKSTWYAAEIAAGAELSARDSETLEEAWESIYKDVEQPPYMEKKARGKKAVVAPVVAAPVVAAPVPTVAAPVPTVAPPVVAPPVKKIRAKKTTAIVPEPIAAPPPPAPVVAPAVAPAAPPVPTVAPPVPTVAPPVPTVAPPAAPPVKKRGPPKKVAPLAAPIGLVTSELNEHVRIIDIHVRKTTISDRSVYLGPKDKVYDLKFNYIGRYNRSTDAIVSHPDSDAD